MVEQWVLQMAVNSAARLVAPMADLTAVDLAVTRVERWGSNLVDTMVAQTVVLRVACSEPSTAALSAERSEQNLAGQKVDCSVVSKGSQSVVMKDPLKVEKTVEH